MFCKRWIKKQCFQRKKGENLNQIFTLKYGVPNCLNVSVQLKIFFVLRRSNFSTVVRIIHNKSNNIQRLFLMILFISLFLFQCSAIFACIFCLWFQNASLTFTQLSLLSDMYYLEYWVGFFLRLNPGLLLLKYNLW